MNIWVFTGEGGRFPSGVFSSRDGADAWIAKHALSGVLTSYPLDSGVYEWAVSQGYFGADKPVSSGLVGKFSSAYQEHYHYTEGVMDGSAL
jgi:hypothetical protein